jgi:hypothetical protein
VNGTGKGSCTIADFGIRRVEPFGSTTLSNKSILSHIPDFLWDIIGSTDMRPAMQYNNHG